MSFHPFHFGIKAQFQVLVMFVSAAICEIAASYLMDALSGFYGSISEQDSDQFNASLKLAIIIILLVTVFKSLLTYACESCALNWRISLVDHVHARFLLTKCERINKQHLINTKQLDNIDQRVTQDIELLTSHGAELLSKVMLLPFVVAYYSYFLVQLLGWQVPVVVTFYFVVGSGVSALLASRVVGLVYQQEFLEGDFRFAHAWLRIHRATVALLRGETFEQANLNEKFTSLKQNKEVLIFRSLHLNLATNLFDYAGAIVNYAVVGYAIFHWGNGGGGSDGDDGSSSRVDMLARGSYACLYLVNAFSQLVDCSRLLADIVGLHRRVSELLVTIEAKPCENENNNDHVVVGFAMVQAPYHVGTSDLATVSDKEIEKSYPTPLVVFDLQQQQPVLLRVINLNIWATGCDSVLLIKALSLELRRGMRLLITGPSGCGKSTLLGILAQMAISQAQERNAVEQRSGGGGGSRSLSERQYSLLCDEKDIVVCPQSSYCFPGSLRQNLLYPTWEPAKVTRSVHSDQHGSDSEYQVECVNTRRWWSSLSGWWYTHVNHQRQLSTTEELLLDENGLPADSDTNAHNNNTNRRSSSDRNSDAEVGLWNEDEFNRTTQDELETILQQVELENLVPYLLPDLGAPDNTIRTDSGAANSSNAVENNSIVSGRVVDTLKKRNITQRDWSTTLSGGEKQRLCVARLLLRRPKLCFLDEVTSALDDNGEDMIYHQVSAVCDTFVSVGHRDSIRRFHSHELRVDPRTQSYELTPL